MGPMGKVGLVFLGFRVKGFRVRVHGLRGLGFTTFHGLGVCYLDFRALGLGAFWIWRALGLGVLAFRGLEV